MAYTAMSYPDELDCLLFRDQDVRATSDHVYTSRIQFDEVCPALICVAWNLIV